MERHAAKRPAEYSENHRKDHQVKHRRWRRASRAEVGVIKTRIAVGMALIFATGSALATPQEFSDLEVREIGTGRSADGIYIGTSNSANSLDGCGSTFFIEAGHPLLNQNLAIALAAMYAKSRVQIQVDGCNGAGAMQLKSVNALR
jgi:hypothetical protein